MSSFIKRALRSSFFIITSLTIVFGCVTYAGAYTSPVKTLRVGLCFESNGTAMTKLVLTNSVGKGFSFGTYDSSRNFVKNQTAAADNSTAINVSVVDGKVTVTDASSGALLFSVDTSASKPLAIVPNQIGTAKCVTGTNWNYSYYGGFDVSSLKSGKLQVINVVNIEDYVKGVIPVEMSPEWPIEALKAQAMCARNYVVNRIGYHGDFDVCDSTDCQVYAGTRFANTVTDAAVDATAGKYVLYNGSPCETYFCSSNGGATESSDNVWVTALPYLTAKFDEYEKNVDTGYNSWTYTYSAAEITDILKSDGYNIGTVTSIAPTYTSVGNIYSITFGDGTNFITVYKQDAGNILCSSKYGKYTHSQRFTITGSSSGSAGFYINDASNNLESIYTAYAIGGGESASPVTVDSGKVSVLTGNGLQTIDVNGSGKVQYGTSFVVKGSGWGHNVGMSQYGAKAMALMGKTYEEIIKYYFTGVTIG